MSPLVHFLLQDPPIQDYKVLLNRGVSNYIRMARSLPSGEAFGVSLAPLTLSHVLHSLGSERMRSYLNGKTEHALIPSITSV